MSRTQRIGFWSVCCLAAWLLLSSLIGVVAMEGALHPYRRPLLAQDEALARAISSRNDAVLTDVAIRATDGATLRAWSLLPRSGNGDAVILLHGQGDNRAGVLGNADLLLRHGYSVLLPDSRAHGASGGPITTYGVLEAEDVHRWYEWLEQSEDPRCIDGLGESMGAAILLQALAGEPGFCSVVAESSFSTFREAAYLRLGQGLGAGSRLGETVLRPAAGAGLLYARLRYGVDLARAAPEEAVAQTQIPILLIHGLADTNLPPRFSEEMKARNPTVALWEPANAGHCGAASAEPAEYERRVTSWFAEHDKRGGVAN
jgi:uncharacterized protein